MKAMILGIVLSLALASCQSERVDVQDTSLWTTVQEELKKNDKRD